MQTAVAAEPRTARKVHKWNKPTRDHFVDLAKKISASYEVSLSDEDVDFGSAGSAHGKDVESNVSDDDAQSQGADSAASIETYVSCGAGYKMRPSRGKPEERRPWTRPSRGKAEDEHTWEIASLPSR